MCDLSEIGFLGDSELLRLMRRGSQAALEEVYRRYLPSVWRYVYSQVQGDWHAAEDTVSETFLAAVTGLERLDPDSGPIYPWLVGVARHKLADRRRRLRRVSGNPPAAGPQLLDPVDSGNTKDRLEVVEGRQQVANTMTRLPDDQRLALEWKYVDGLSVREIANRTGRTEKAIDNLLYRARRAFRTAFHNA